MRIPVLSLVVAVLAGTWMAHAVEYVRVWGPSGFPDAVSRSAHTYFGPAGLVLAALAGGCVVGAVRLQRRLTRRLRELEHAPAGPVEATTLRATCDISRGNLVVLLLAVQLGLYVAQENLEARAFGLRLPGLGCISGVHAVAPLVHLLVAELVALVLWFVYRKVTEALAEVRAAESRLAMVVPRRHEPPAVPNTANDAPLRRWGAQRWSRPPPALA